MPTITDVARQAGVSMKTVSRVLNDEPHVRPALRARVEAAVAQLGYRPNLAARQLASQRSFIIPSPAYITDVLMGAAVACRDRGYHLAAEPIDLNETALPVIERMILTLRPDGIILIPPLSDMTNVVDLIERHEIRLVRIAGRPKMYGASIVVDDRLIARTMVEHLVEQGHRRIGFIMPHPDHAIAQSRFRGYLDGLEQANIIFEPSLVQPGLFDVESGATAATTLLDLPNPPTAIFAANDDMALGALRVAHLRGLRIPKDVAIAGFDDSPASSLAYPGLTTVRQPTRTMGEFAAASLLGDTVDPNLQHELIVRGSTIDVD
jgi:LacI family transcriptional regulator